MKSISRLFASLVLVLVLLMGSSGCQGVPAHDITVKLSFSEPPVLEKTVELTATFRVIEGARDAHNVTARIILPDGLEKVSGDLEWNGDMLRDNVYTVSALVKTIKTGVWEVTANAFFHPSADSSFGGSRTIYVSVSESGATVSDYYPSGPNGPTVTAMPYTPATNPVVN
jgi:hypothetical protein